MNEFLLNRSQGSIAPWTFQTAQCARLVQCLAPAPGIRFSSAPRPTVTDDGILNSDAFGVEDAIQDEVWAHKAGVNVLAIDHYEKRFMLSGGADASVHLWDLENRGAELSHLHTPVASVSKSSSPEAHKNALTSISIYPFDPVPSTILTTSHDTTLKLSTIGQSEITPVHTFSLHSTPYSHSLSSHQSSHLLIGVGTSDRSVRLLDLRSGLSTHSLPGHTGAVLSVQWAPHNPHLIASGSKDNRVLIFDVRRGGHSSIIASLDMDDAVGVLPPSPSDNTSTTFYPRNPYTVHSRAHNGAVTGLRWTPHGTSLITAGQDSRIRIWNTNTGANTLIHLGPRIRNSASLHLAERAPLICHPSFASFTNTSANAANPESTLFAWPNYADPDDRGEIFMFALVSADEAKPVAQLKIGGVPARMRRAAMGKPSALTAARINALVWRGNGAAGEGMEMFSGHGDGTVRCWASRTEEDVEYEEEAAEERGRKRGGSEGGEEDEEMQERKRKRDVLEEVYRGLMEPGVRFT